MQALATRCPALEGALILVIHSQNLYWAATVPHNLTLWCGVNCFLFCPMKRKSPPLPLLETLISPETNSLKHFL